MISDPARSPRPSSSWGNSSPSLNSNRRGKTTQSIQQSGSPDSSKSASTQKAGALQHVPCKFFKNGACNAGKNCIFSHSMDLNPESAVCKYYLKGNCKFGNKCALLHSKGLNGLNGSLRPNGVNGKIENSMSNGRGMQREDFPMLSPERVQYHQESPPHTLFPRGAVSRTIHDNSSPHYVGLPGSPYENNYGYGPESPFLPPTDSLFGQQTSSRQPMSISLPSHDPTFFDMLGLSPSSERLDTIYTGRGHGSPFMPLSAGGLPHLESPRRSLDPISEAELKLDVLKNLHIDDNFSYSQGILPSSLDELLTPNEIETRRSSFLGSPVSNNKPPSLGRFSRSHNEDSYFGNISNSYTPGIGITPPVSRRSQSNSNLDFVSSLWKNDLETDYSNAITTFDDDLMGSFSSRVSPLTIPKGNPPLSTHPFEASTSKSNGVPSFSLDEDIQFYMEEEGDHFVPQKRDQSPLKDSLQNQPLCPFGETGNCHYGSSCQYIHGLPCPSCFKFVLHPYQNPQQHQAHITECLTKHIQTSEQNLQSVDPYEIKCELCFEKVLSTPDSRFGILNCEHPFCLDCIREWRVNQSPDSELMKSCPTCRKISHFIIPSSTWLVDRTEKQQLFHEYKSKLR
ncbi:E3 ubiquitin-protein ligase makorin-1, variant 3 [Basidiobolus ranarum]|uniref:E3 ubiquitin-protein ligase makorin-1, variant 3 n=1 Tax=Basidiobolus ranarum TaxID=34480 RepID=A0ABR2VZS6_9FUNG